MERWNPRREIGDDEKYVLKLVEKSRKLFMFLRLQRHLLFDDAFQAELEAMYRSTGAGSEPIPPAFMCTVLLLQGYLRVSDADAVTASAVDARWQLALDCLGAQKPAFSQGGLQRFRERLIAADMDRRLLERTVELAKQSKEFDWKKLPKDLRVAIDSRPLEGAGRVEDTINLLGHAARKIVALVANFLEMPKDEVCRLAGVPLLNGPSVKAGLDLDWNDRLQRAEAVEILCGEITSLHDWLEGTRLANEAPLQPFIDAIAQIQAQDLEVGEDGSVRIRRGVAEDRRVSIEDPDMRHGRKSKTKRFNGYKEHVATDVDTDLILACEVTPANRPEEIATAGLKRDMDRQRITIGTMFIDRGYINSDLAEAVNDSGADVVCKPWKLGNSNINLFSKSAFILNMRAQTITCPAGETEAFEPGDVVEFDPEVCGPCSLRSNCTHAASGKGRTVKIAEDEHLQVRLRRLQATPQGRERLRERVPVEHRLAHISARKGHRARYRGTRKNLFDLRRAAVIQNLETVQRVQRADRIRRAA
jgi:hypothetical protein